MTTLREAAQQALEALKIMQPEVQMGEGDAAITALKAALAEPVQEAVASIYITPNGAREFDDWRHDLPVGRNLLYPAPPQRKPLTDEEIERLWYPSAVIAEPGKRRVAFGRAVERAHGIGGEV